VSDTQKPPPPLCVFCNAPWTDDMMKVLVQASIYVDFKGESVEAIRIKLKPKAAPQGNGNGTADLDDEVPFNSGDRSLIAALR
jgi:hypothetical protein